jgi:hypothetical protein
MGAVLWRWPMSGKPIHYRLGGEGTEGTEHDAETGSFGATGKESRGQHCDAKAAVSYDVEKLEEGTAALVARRGRMRKAERGKHGTAWREAVVAEIVMVRGCGPSLHPHAEADSIGGRVNSGLKARQLASVSSDYIADRLKEFPLS